MIIQMIVVASNPRFIITCKRNKGGTQKLPKYVTYTETEKLKKSSNKKNINPIKKFLIGIFGEEIDYNKFNKESKWSIRKEERDDERKTKKW